MQAIPWFLFGALFVGGWYLQPRFTAWLKAGPGRRGRRRVIIWTHPPMTEAELQAALGSLTLDDPTLRAVLQVLQENLDNATSEVGAVSIADRPGMLAHTAGGIEWLQFLQADLASLMNGETRRQFKPSQGSNREAGDVEESQG
tara:strand:- start:327 stop:758 length:432 start_codon:yes stop_codon:yes gene_type:complete